MEKSLNQSQIVSIVLTGGPCAGKSTALERIQREYDKYGWKVLFIPESATDLITSGMNPEFCGDLLAFEQRIMELQLAKEKLFREAAEATNEKVLIVCDRGIPDAKAYVGQQEYQQLLQSLHLDEISARDRYDGVFHLVTAADGAEEAYTLSNNAARKETPEEARAIDKKTMNAWVGHPHMRIIDNSTSFEEKMQRLIMEISLFLGEPEPFEIERKFLIKYPDLAMLEAAPNCRKAEILQTYLKSENGERRVRQRGQDGSYIYWITEKFNINATTRIEKEQRLSEREYVHYLLEADTAAHPIRKTRYCLMANNQYFEIDIYPEWQDQAIMEIELRSEDEEIRFPQGIEIIKEVTGDKGYSNYSLSRNR